MGLNILEQKKSADILETDFVPRVNSVPSGTLKIESKNAEEASNAFFLPKTDAGFFMKI